MTFSQKLISVTFTPGANGTSGGGSGGLTSPLALSNLRMSCHVSQVGDRAMGQMTLLIWGMTLDHMNQLSTLGWVQQKIPTDMCSVSAGDAQTGLTLIYKGTVWQAVSDFQDAANVPFRVECLSGQTESGVKIPPTSINNKAADVGQMMSQLAGKMGLQFENNGVSQKIAYPYLPGTARTQAMQLAKAAGIGWVIDRGVLAIWPQGQARMSSGTPLISPQTGMVGYPSWSSVGVKVKTEFNPQLQFGGTVQIQSSVTPAVGTWQIKKLTHDLESFKPSGQWFTTIECSKLGSPVLAQ